MTNLNYARPGALDWRSSGAVPAGSITSLPAIAQALRVEARQ